LRHADNRYVASRRVGPVLSIHNIHAALREHQSVPEVSI
jgi:hypothetical protein